jgi:hypothetical protein
MLTAQVYSRVPFTDSQEIVMRVAIRSLVFVVLSTALPAIAADLTIVSKVTHDGGPAETSTSYISSDHVRMSQPDGNEAIIDLKSGQMTVLQGKKKTYYVITRQDMDAAAARVKEQMNSPEMKKAQEQMNNLPPEQKKQMEAAMGGMFAYDVQKAGTTRTIAGYKCENWTVTIGQFSKSLQCVTNELKFPAQSMDMYRSYADSMKNMMAAMGPMAMNMAAIQEKAKKMKGFPLANATTTNVMGQRSVTTSEVTAIREGSIPASTWEIPAGYKKVDNPMMQSLGQRGKR